MTKAKILDGKMVSQRIKDELKAEVNEMKAKGIVPGLAVIIVGDDPASRVYVNSKKRACAEIGIYSEEYALPVETTEKELLELVNTLNKKDDIRSKENEKIKSCRYWNGYDSKQRTFSRA